MVSIDDIRTAATRIAGRVHRTPVLTCRAIDALAGATFFFKCENLQHVGAFKARGACNAVFSLSDEESQAGVVAHSSGNHAAALARAATLRRIGAHIVMPHNSSAVKIAAVTLENWMLFDVDLNVQVARWPAVLAGLTFVG